MSINLDFLDKKFQDLVAKGNFLQITKATQNLEAQSTFRLGTNSVRALTRVSSGEDILVFKNDSDGLLYAIAGRRDESRVINQRTILSRHTRPFRSTPGILGLLETFVIRIENPKVDDIHVLDPHQFWGVKVKDIRIVGGELEFILRKEGETDKVLAKGGTVPKDWGLLAKVKAVEDEELPPGSTEEPKKVRGIVCSMALEHKSGHRTGWETIPFSANNTYRGSYSIFSQLPYACTLIAFVGYPDIFEYKLTYSEPNEEGGVTTGEIDLDVLAEEGVELKAMASVSVAFKLKPDESNPDGESFCGALLLKRGDKDDKIERFRTAAWIDSDGDHLLDPYIHSSGAVIWPPGADPPEPPPDPPPQSWPPYFEFFVREDAPAESSEEFVYTPIVFTPDVLSIPIKKGAAIIVRATGTQPYVFNKIEKLFWIKRKN